MGDADAVGRDLDVEPEHFAGAGCVPGAFGDGGSCPGRRGNYGEPDVCDGDVSLRAMEDGARADAGAAGDHFAGDAGWDESVKRRWEQRRASAARQASQVAANLGVAALVSNGLVLSWMVKQSWLPVAKVFPAAAFSVGLAALAEAAADTVSSELGQVLSGHPRMITTFRRAEPGMDGAISVGGTVAGIIAGGLVAAAGAWVLDWDGECSH